MLDEDEKGILFQIFTKPIGTRPTMFLEFIQREKCEGFGTANIEALYETLEV
jgi:4-hydroxyphenylpyruvate dioxygenase